jgi:hypothetical protein
MLVEQLRRVASLTTRKIEQLQDFHAFTGHSYDRYSKMSAAGHLKGSVTNARTKTVLRDDELAAVLLGYLDNELASIVVYQLVSTFEDFFFDFVELLLRNNPHALSQKRQVAVEDIIAAADMPSLIGYLINSELENLRYKRVDEWFAFLRKVIGLSSIKPEDIERIAELKASRDILAHNASITNDIYVRKAGKLARGEPGQRLPMTRPYVYGSADFLKEFISRLATDAESRLSSG